MKLWITSKMTKIFRLDSGRCYCYLCEKNGYYFLIDTGLEKDRGKLIRELKRLRVHKIDAIFITHVHTDHIGNAEYLRKQYNSKVYVPSEELAFAGEGSCKRAEGISPLGRIMNFFIYRKDVATKFDAVPEAIGLPDQKISKVKKNGRRKDLSLKVLQTPGHTKGSVSYIIDEEVAVVGDTMSHSFVGNIYPVVAEEEEHILESWKELLMTKAKLFLPAHGREIKRRLLAESYSVYEKELVRRSK